MIKTKQPERRSLKEEVKYLIDTKQYKKLIRNHDGNLSKGRNEILINLTSLYSVKSIKLDIIKCKVENLKVYYVIDGKKIEYNVDTEKYFDEETYSFKMGGIAISKALDSISTSILPIKKILIEFETDKPGRYFMEVYHGDYIDKYEREVGIIFINADA